MKRNQFFLCIVVLVLAAGTGNVLYSQIAPAPRPYFNYTVVPETGSWNFTPNEEAALRIMAYAGGNSLDGIEVSFEAGNDMMPADTSGIVRFENGTALIRFGTMPSPGFRTCWFNFTFAGKGYREMVKAGFSPEKIMPTVTMPDDFASFWEKAKKDAAGIPMKTEITPLPEYSTEKINVSLVRISCWPEGHSIYGYLCAPKQPGKYPVLLTPPGAGVKRFAPSTDYAEAGFISLSIEIHGISPMAGDEEFKPTAERIGEYIYTGLNDKEDYYFKKVYLSCIRAMDFLCSQPDYDGINAGVCGGSQGGALAIVTAGLDPRIRFLASFYPALSDMTGYLYGRAGGWPKYFAAKELEKLPVPVETAVETIAYYDVVNFARFLTAPGFYSYGYCDNTCPPTPVSAAINAVTAPKEVVVTPASAHWRFPETNQRSIEWMKSKLKKE